VSVMATVCRVSDRWDRAFCLEGMLALVRPERIPLSREPRT